MAQVIKAGYWYCQSNFPVEDIDSSLFTHLFAAFANVNATSYQVVFPERYEVQFEYFTESVRKRNPDVKTILSIVGDPSIFRSMTSRPGSRQTFIDASIYLARSYNYDGLSLHWRYPYTSEEMANLGSLLTEWRAAVNEDSRCTGEAPLLLTAAVFYSSDYWSSLKYPIQAISDSLDWVNVWADDVYTPDCSPKLTGPPAPLYNPTSCELSVDSGIRAWIHAGVPANKLVLCLPFHGRSWLLVNAENHEIFSPANGPVPDSDPIPYSRIETIGAVKQFDPSYVTDYCYSGTTWIGYDDKDSISTKVRYAKKKGLLGYFAWHLDDDDTVQWTLSREASEAWDNA
ncbi:class V chitinase-like [Alnus glutinosa]|uniref:class V chitinase-like n=1 Tax=Alnus glutinosa TaxID=3517 RepID=UPI002D77FAB7|nr:class V chitinase-like [Alnus glutinosa]XP_062159956.1 class V chitinase-like [Alnus glutinosa]